MTENIESTKQIGEIESTKQIGEIESTKQIGEIESTKQISTGVPRKLVWKAKGKQEPRGRDGCDIIAQEIGSGQNQAL
jgi:hypothetical protein